MHTVASKPLRPQATIRRLRSCAGVEAADPPTAQLKASWEAKKSTKTTGLAQDDAWMAFSTAETKAADQAVVERYSAFTLPVGM